MDVALLVKHRLKELALEQKDLAAAAGVTESAVSRKLTRAIEKVQRELRRRGVVRRH